MKKIIPLALFFIATMSTMHAQDWNTNFEEAKATASKENKPIILVFQGSDWCAPCIKLDHDIWSTDAFKKYANDNYVLVLADFPRKKKNALSEVQTKANAKLAEIYNKNGFFPLVVVLDDSGKVLGQTGYKKISPENYIKELNAFVD